MGKNSEAIRMKELEIKCMRIRDELEELEKTDSVARELEHMMKEGIRPTKERVLSMADRSIESVQKKRFLTDNLIDTQSEIFHLKVQQQAQEQIEMYENLKTMYTTGSKEGLGKALDNMIEILERHL